MTDIAYPFHIDIGGQTARTDPDRHLRELIEQILLTTPGERVMRPGFGTGLAAMVFAPVGSAIAAALESSVQAALQQELGSRAEILSVQVRAEDSTLNVEIAYRPAGGTPQSLQVEVQP